MSFTGTNTSSTGTTISSTGATVGSTGRSRSTETTVGTTNSVLTGASSTASVLNMDPGSTNSSIRIVNLTSFAPGSNTDMNVPTNNSTPVTSIHSGNGEGTTSGSVGAFLSALQNAGLGNLALMLGNSVVNLIEATVANASHSISLVRTSGNERAVSDHMALWVPFIQSQIEHLQRVAVGSSHTNDDSLVVIDDRTIELAINIAIDRMHNTN